MAGDYMKLQRHYGSLSTNIDITGLLPALPYTLLTVKNASYQVYLQQAKLMVATFYACTVTLQSHTTGLVLARFDVPAAAATAGSNAHFRDAFEYGPTGISAPIGESVDLVLSHTGVVAVLAVEAYQRLAQTISAASGAANQ
jgi:hypothetical protein